MSVLDRPAYRFLHLHGQGISAVSIFRGLWLFPSGMRVIWGTRMQPTNAPAA